MGDGTGCLSTEAEPEGPIRAVVVDPLQSPGAEIPFSGRGGNQVALESCSRPTCDLLPISGQHERNVPGRRQSERSRENTGCFKEYAQEDACAVQSAQLKGFLIFRCMKSILKLHARPLFPRGD